MTGASFRGPHSVMIHAGDVAAALDWYSRLFGVAPVERASEYSVLPVGAVDVCFHPADSKVSSGRAGTVVYWQVENLAGARSHAESLGAVLHRGPLEVEDGQAICQLRDPFGNLFGLIGSG